MNDENHFMKEIAYIFAMYLQTNEVTFFDQGKRFQIVLNEIEIEGFGNKE